MHHLSVFTLTLLSNFMYHGLAFSKEKLSDVCRIQLAVEGLQGGVIQKFCTSPAYHGQNINLLVTCKNKNSTQCLQVSGQISLDVCGPGNVQEPSMTFHFLSNTQKIRKLEVALVAPTSEENSEILDVFHLNIDSTSTGKVIRQNLIGIYKKTRIQVGTQRTCPDESKTTLMGLPSSLNTQSPHVVTEVPENESGGKEDVVFSGEGEQAASTLDQMVKASIHELQQQMDELTKDGLTVANTEYKLNSTEMKSMVDRKRKSNPDAIDKKQKSNQKSIKSVVSSTPATKPSSTSVTKPSSTSTAKASSIPSATPSPTVTTESPVSGRSTPSNPSDDPSSRGPPTDLTAPSTPPDAELSPSTPSIEVTSSTEMYETSSYETETEYADDEAYSVTRLNDEPMQQSTEQQTESTVNDIHTSTKEYIERKEDMQNIPDLQEVISIRPFVAEANEEIPRVVEEIDNQEFLDKLMDSLRNKAIEGPPVSTPLAFSKPNVPTVPSVGGGATDAPSARMLGGQPTEDKSDSPVAPTGTQTNVTVGNPVAAEKPRQLDPTSANSSVSPQTVITTTTATETTKVTTISASTLPSVTQPATPGDGEASKDNETPTTTSTEPPETATPETATPETATPETASVSEAGDKGTTLGKEENKDGANTTPSATIISSSIVPTPTTTPSISSAPDTQTPGTSNDTQSTTIRPEAIRPNISNSSTQAPNVATKKGATKGTTVTEVSTTNKLTPSTRQPTTPIATTSSSLNKTISNASKTATAKATSSETISSSVSPTSSPSPPISKTSSMDTTSHVAEHQTPGSLLATSTKANGDVLTQAGDDDTFWPVVAALVIGIPSVIVFGIAITVIHKRRKIDTSRAFYLGGHHHRHSIDV